ncbi:ATPase family associated with various cellular activities (AAA) [Fodinibius roseus]|uniref:ATPase family associated with various cellular activities (AAA) n=1 Tax=Fodinibius roseus TaxID=1194090 RepID=A0A1M4ZKM2_9BACT|nr:ATP-binding protein [Fodinibius roseus]SHF18367.1 ATPase family associated with various cellular activities (AAA) [Fodinibius roseus]
MVAEKIEHNARDLKAELDWFREILKTRSKLNAGEETRHEDVYDIPPPNLNGPHSTYARFVKKHELDFEARFLLILAMVPHIKPELLDVFLTKNQNTQQIFTEFGGKKGKNHQGFLPTGETAMFILAGSDLRRRFSIQGAFDANHLFRRENILWLENMENGEPRMSGALQISKEVLDLLTIGELRKPDFSAEFPAKLLTTKMAWDDLVLSSRTLEQLDELETWIRNHHTLRKDWGMEKKLKPGYKALFYGPPGTGKTLTATLLGKKTGRDVYRIDLSQTVSKYIGETEKNLANIFDRAEHKEWILFFDEADALFGNRTSTKDAHDRYANQQVSYLLQRIEDYDGLVILASNLKNNIDNAFLRRLQAMIHFPVPSYSERLELWKQGFSNAARLGNEIDLKAIAKEYKIAGGTIINVIQHSSLKALGRDSNKIRLRDITGGIKRELHKSRRTI